MWSNYLTVGARHLFKNKTYAAINIVGLALGLAACMLILLYVRYEFSYDKWIPGAEDVYQIQTFASDSQTGEVRGMQVSANATGDAFAKDHPQVLEKSRMIWGSTVVLRDGQASEVDFSLVDEPFFRIFPLPFVAGGGPDVMKNLYSVVLTEEEAIKRFGKTDVVGQTLTLSTDGLKQDWRVTGVLKTIPKNTHFGELTMIGRINPADYSNSDMLTSWFWFNGYNYVKLRPGTDTAAINAGMDAWAHRVAPTSNFGGTRTSPADTYSWKLTNIADVHLGEANPGNDRGTIITFVVIAGLILGMACVNFTNLATARASQRAREVALRKVLGATRKQLMVQFIGEAILVTGLATLLALALAELFLSFLNDFLDSSISLSYLGKDSVLLPIILFALLVGTTAGLYPAFYLSRFQPAKVLKANKSAADAEGSGKLRNVLVIAQFAISIGLVVCTAIVYQQTIYARSADAGYKKEGLLQLSLTGGREIYPIAERMEAEIRRVDGVKSAARTSIAPAADITQNVSVTVAGKTDLPPLGSYAIHPDFFETMGIRFLAGRNLTTTRAMDDATTPPNATLEDERRLVARGLNVVIDAVAVRELGLGSPQQALGKQIGTGLASEEVGPLPVTVVGVVPELHFRSPRAKPEPLMFRYDREGTNTIVVRYDSASPAQVRDAVEQIWKRLAPDMPFKAEFAEDRLAKLYERDVKRGQTFASFALLAVVIACLGLYGLASFTAERRTKEIGIRKVLGAWTGDIVKLLTLQFSKPVLIANIIAWPVAWWLMRDWLNDFQVRIDLTPVPFVLSGLLALAVALATMAGHAIRIARANPVHALRYE